MPGQLPLLWKHLMSQKRKNFNSNTIYRLLLFRILVKNWERLLHVFMLIHRKNFRSLVLPVPTAKHPVPTYWHNV